MMESTLVTDGADPSAAAPAPIGGANDDDPLFSSASGGGDDDLFGSIDDVVDAAGSGSGMASSKSDLMGALLGGDNPLATISSYETAPEAVAAPSPSASKLSASGLLGESSAGSSSGGLFGNDEPATAGGGGGSGLFDDVDAEQERQKLRAEAVEEERLRAEAEAAAATAAQQEQNVDVMHELNLNDNNSGQDYGMGMGMGLGGEIPKSPPPAAAGQYGQGYGQHHQAPPPPQQQQQYGQPQYHQQQQHHQPQQQQGVMNAMAGSYYYSTTGAGQMTGPGSRQPQQQQQHPNNAQGPPQPSVLAGMHVGHDVNLGGVAPPLANGNNNHNNIVAANAAGFDPVPGAVASYVASPPFDPLYGKIVVSDPMLIQGTGLFAGPPHWTYLVTVHAKGAASNNGAPAPPPVSAVRRRFRHIVALEDRLRASVPGAILPPRPDKHPARAIEEATARQSSDFAKQRASELGAYMNSLSSHPFAGPSPELKLFLTLQDHIGTAWPEVSSSAFTRMTAVGAGAVEKMTDAVDGVLGELGAAQQVAAGEDSAEVLALAAHEGRRIGAVSNSVPKVEGCASLVRERGDRLGASGLEMSKLARDVSWCDRDLAAPMEVLSGALLRSGRRTKRLGLELGAAISPFVVQYRTCRYEQMAFADRRTALKRRTEARGKADGRAAKLMMNQASMQGMGRLGSLGRMESEAAMYDEMATEEARIADDVATRLRSEVGRIAAIRAVEWRASVRVIASSMKEACGENAAVWEGALEAFKREFPDCPGVQQAMAVGGATGV